MVRIEQASPSTTARVKVMSTKKGSKVPPPPDLPSAISGHEKESSEADAKLRDTATRKAEQLKSSKEAGPR
jgi:hypothetical protein